MKRLKFVTAIVLSAIMFATPVCQVYAEDYTEVKTESETESVSDDSSVQESDADSSNDTSSEDSDFSENDTTVAISDVLGGSEISENSTGDGLEIYTDGTSEDQVTGVENSEGDESSDEVAAGASVELITTSDSGYNAYSSELDNDLTVILRGLDESNKTATVELINRYISTIIETGKYLNITDSSYVDAEKYNIWVDGYDANHCWAATAANILWTTGYAQQAINPYTKNYFTSEDEVLSYFSENFTDAAGVPEAGCNWFFTGYYPYNSNDGVSHTKNNSSGGLLPGVDYLSSRSFLTCIINNASAMSALESVSSFGMGVLVRWLQADGTLTDGAHWMAVVGTIIDEAEESVYERYKAIVLANSDNDPVNDESVTSENISNISMATKLSAKLSEPNKYTVYRLSYDSAKKWWTIDNFSSSTTVITYLYSLLDSNKTPEGCGGETEPEVIISEETKEIFVIEPENTKTTMTENYFYSLTTEELNEPENLAQLHDFMVNNNVPAFLPSKGVVSEGQNLDVFVTAPQTFISGVSADDVQIPMDAFYVTETQNGLSKLMIKDSYLKLLSKGKHIIRIRIQGFATPVEFEINIL